MRARTVFAAVAATCLLAGACGGSGNGGGTQSSPHGTPSQPGLALLSNPARVHDPAAAGRAAAAENAFAGALYGALPANGHNLVLSPMSIASVLQMLTLGARGQTATQLEHALQVPRLPRHRLAREVAALRAQLATLARDGQVHTADAIWVQNGLRIDKHFMAALHTAFAAGAVRTDFAADPGGARTQINAAIAQATHGRITNLIPPGVVNNLTRVVLTDAIYLKARWAHPFDPQDTSSRPFTRADGSTVTVPTMQRTGSLSYAQKNGYQVATLPYAGGRMAMQILLPDGPLGPLERRLETHGLSSLTGGESTKKVELSLPRWNITAAPKLKPTLGALGVHDAFDPTKADLRGITTQEQLYLSAIVHKAMIRVGEKGTEAAAATGGVAGITAAPAVDARMQVDHPFLFAITDTATRTPLFLGRVTDPTGH